MSSEQRTPRLVFMAFVLILSLLIVLPGCSPAKRPFPHTEKKTVIDQYHGVRVTDDYRWLADLNDPAVRTWVKEQNAFTRSYLDKISARTTIIERLKKLYFGASVSYTSLTRSGKLFAIKRQPPKEQPILVTLDSPDDLTTERTVVDPNTLDPEGTTTIDFFVPSPDGRLVAISLSQGDTEDGSVSVFETATGMKRADLVPRVNYPTGGGSLAWNPKGSGFYYTRYPQGDERPAGEKNFYQQVFFHTLGTPSSKDTYVTGKDFPRIAEIRLATGEGGKYLLVTVANGDGGEFAHYLMGPGKTWRQITGYTDRVYGVIFGGNGILYLLSHNNAPQGKVLSLPLKNPDLSKASMLIPQSNVTIESLTPTKSRLFVQDLIGGSSQVRIFDLHGVFQNLLPTPQRAAVSTLEPLGNDEILYSTQTYLEPLSYFRHDPVTNSTVHSRLSGSSAADFSDCEVVGETATSKDGRTIPLNILRKKGITLNGRNPVILSGYGGYNIPLRPTFSVRNRLWLEQGGIYVYVNLRGGGEFGEEWHNAGKLTQKQNVFDDFIACAQRLIDLKYTTPSLLAIEGRSNGGLLMGAVMTQRPDLFRAVVSHVGIYDMLRSELFPNGSFNTTEFGSINDPDQFKALYAYSPYHHVEDGKAYPAVLMLTGDNDGRVDPANSRTMTARLQAATSSNSPIMLRTSGKSGHGMGTGLSELVAQDADVFTFLFDQLQVPIK